MSNDDNRMDFMIEAEVQLKAGKYDEALRLISAFLSTIVYEKSHLQRIETIYNSCYSKIIQQITIQTQRSRYEERRVEEALDFAQLAACYQKIGEWQSSIRMWNKTIEFQSMSESILLEKARGYKISDYLNNTHYNLGVCYEEINDLEKAVDSLIKAIDYKSRDTDALFNLGMFSARLKRYSDSIDAFERFLNIDTESENAQQVKHVFQQAKRDFESQR